MPTVSIIMGIYNCEKTIDVAIQSILDQTYTDWELIMCDDGSSDNTYKIANSYYQKYPEKIILLKNKENMKLAKTLNRCLSKATGEYIARMDADDICLNYRLEKQVDFLEKNRQYQLVGSTMIPFDENGDKKLRGKIGEISNCELLKGSPFCHPTIMMRKEIYEKLKGYRTTKEVARCEDVDLWFRFYARGYKGYVLEEPLLRYRESLSDYKKRKLKHGIEAAMVFYRGYKLLGYKKYYYFFACKPIISALIPNKIMYAWHRRG